MEIEAKLGSSRRVNEEIARLAELAGYVLRAEAAVRLETTYLDTAERDLARARVALRIRTGGPRVELTLKESGRRAGAVHHRPERTWLLDAPPALPFTAAPAALRGRLAHWTDRKPLGAVITTRVERRALRLVPVGRRAAVAEIDLDRLTFVAPGGLASRPRHEVEIELVGPGREADLARVVRALRRRFRLRAAPRSKLEQALRWLDARAGR